MSSNRSVHPLENWTVQISLPVAPLGKLRKQTIRATECQ